MAWIFCCRSFKTIAGVRRRRLLQVVAVAAAAFLWTSAQPVRAGAERDPLQLAINYMLTGTLEPKDAPELVDRKSCAVVVADPKWKRFIRYYLSRFQLDDPRINSTYSGRQAAYQLDVESDKIVVEYLSLDKATVVNGYKSAQVPLPGDIEQTKRAVRYIADHCKGNGETKLPF
jgi:hypothetical protein